MGMIRVGRAVFDDAAQITIAKTFRNCKVAWTYRTGALNEDNELNHKGDVRDDSILVDGKLFLSTPYDHVICFLDPAAGTKIWEFDPKTWI